MTLRLEVNTTEATFGEVVTHSGGGAPRSAIAQVFGVSTAFALTSIAIKTARSVTSTGGTVFLRVFATDANSLPSGAALSTGSIAYAAIPVGENFTSFSMSGMTIAANTTYAIVAFRDTTENFAGDVNWRTLNIGTDLISAAGALWHNILSTDDQATWAVGSGSTSADRLFQLFGSDVSNAGTTNTPSIIADWNADGNFDSTEDISIYVLRANWNRGKEPEQETTPTATMQVVVSDPNGNFLPNSTFWGSGNVDINREIKATTVYQGSTYPLFRGRINNFRVNARPGNDQTVTLFCVDEKEILNTKVISAPNSAETTGGASPDGDDPIEGLTLGSSTAGSTGVISLILDQSSLSSTRRSISEAGSTADLWWTYGVSAKAALDEVEKHEGKTSMLFINSCGSLEFHSSTHREGSTFITLFGPSTNATILFQAMDYQHSARNILNAAEVTVKTYITTTGEVQEIPEPNVSVTAGSRYEWIVPLDKAPVSSVTAPLNTRNSTSGVSIRGITSGDTYADDSHSGLFTMTVLGGGSAVKFALDNTDTTITESISVRRPENYTISDTGFFPLVTQPHNISNVTQESCDPSSITKYGRRFKSFTLPFFGSLDPDLSTGSTNISIKASRRATAEIANNSTAHPDGIRLSLFGSDSDSLTQILTRDMNDRIRINSTQQKLANQDFYITRGEWELSPDNKFSVIWTLQEATA